MSLFLDSPSLYPSLLACCLLVYLLACDCGPLLISSSHLLSLLCWGCFELELFQLPPIDRNPPWRHVRGSPLIELRTFYLRQVSLQALSPMANPTMQQLPWQRRRQRRASKRSVQRHCLFPSISLTVSVLLARCYSLHEVMTLT